MKNKFNKIIRAAEFIFLFFGIPLIIYFESFLTHPSLVLLPILAGIILYFIFTKDFNLKSLVRLNVPKRVIWNQISLVLLTGLFLIVFVYFFKPENLFNLPRENPNIWLLIFFFYPLLSAYSQEVVYRTFLFTRYHTLFKNRDILIIVSGVTFGFAHIVYYHPLSILLTLFAGIYLAWIYRQTKSVLFTAILHSILGILVFTIGLGEYFWLNMEQHL
jgi:membrane protease YdiL (CAAX protease family)